MASGQQVANVSSSARSILMTTAHHAQDQRLVYKWVDSPIGRLRLVATDQGLAALLWEKERLGRVRLNDPVEDPSHRVLVEAERQLDEYFHGRRKRFSLRLDFAGTEFQRQVWAALLTIPFGETRSYAQIANQIGKPSAARAVGAANGRNPIAIVAPCHRVVGATGALTGFAGGLEAKAWLLALESAEQPPRSLFAAAGDGVRR
jgi:methylated-DNA-[protein]-cysteine S-methyltransferase